MTEDNSISFDFPSNRGSTVEQCQRMIHKSLLSPKVRFLKEHLEKAGCSIGDNFIKAIKCDDAGVAGGYTQGQGIVVCCNEMESQDDVNQVLKHELIHAFDDCRAANLDWSSCAHHACSEIRAGHLSGDCHFKRELLKMGSLKIKGHEQDCIRRRVLKSLSASPYCTGVAKAFMESVWDVCYNDTEPYDRAP
ncbi:mitochondrial inner membrane protease ATP23-like [Abrus precatorius]|uniref:Mitochondrial inner membrane protease ATP23 n=1 Tax=Abrus precatorius TaxID=3816 RepID=A0A8B8KW93_ABRPR|nr:mitochondrial inner membrane protease ATP23-like [Abrus precatorius]